MNYLTWSFIDIIHTLFFVFTFAKMKNGAVSRKMEMYNSHFHVTWDLIACCFCFFSGNFGVTMFLSFKKKLRKNNVKSR